MNPTHDPQAVEPGLGDVITDQRACRKCRADLFGAKASGVCPKCGTTIRPKKVKHFTDQMMHAPEGWLRVFTTGATLMLIGGSGVILSAFLGVFAPHPAVLVLRFLAAICWFVGVILATRARPRMDGMDFDPRSEWLGLRWSSRLSQLFVVLAAGAFLGRGVEAPSELFTWLALVTTIVAGVGLAPLCLHLGNTAHWASDESMVGRLRVCVALLPMLVGFGIFSIYNGWRDLFYVSSNGLPLITYWIWGVFCYALCIWTPMGYAIWMLLGLRSMGAWALANHIQEEARTARLLERFQSDRFNADAQREHGVIQDTSQPLTALMPAPGSRASTGTPVDGIRPGNKRPARTIWD